MELIDYLNHLPDELLIIIIDYIFPFSQKLKYYLVCKRWYFLHQYLLETTYKFSRNVLLYTSFDFLIENDPNKSLIELSHKNILKWDNSNDLNYIEKKKVNTTINLKWNTFNLICNQNNRMINHSIFRSQKYHYCEIILEKLCSPNVNYLAFSFGITSSTIKKSLSNCPFGFKQTHIDGTMLFDYGISQNDFSCVVMANSSSEREHNELFIQSFYGDTVSNKMIDLSYYNFKLVGSKIGILLNTEKSICYFFMNNYCFNEFIIPQQFSEKILKNETTFAISIFENNSFKISTLENIDFIKKIINENNF